MRVTVLIRAGDGLEAKLQARTQRQRVGIRREMLNAADRVYARVQDLCPRDTHYMAEHTVLEITRRGYNFAIGWRSGDFVGHINPVTGLKITDFYPVYVVYGTSRMAGRDPLTPSLQAERPRTRRNLALVLRDA